MAGIKISDLPAAPSSVLTDVFPADQGAITYKESLQQVLTLFQANGTALSRANDTNVTITLGGSPSIALLNPTTLTMGWTGQLSPARGGTGVNNGSSTLTLAGNLATIGAFASDFTMTGATSVTFPTSGTLATTSQLPTPAALTKTDDTNVTLTLGGTPTTALLQATSLTLGWTGTLSGTRGGTGVNNGASTITIGGNVTFTGGFTFAGTITGNTAVTFPTSGTLATTSQIPTGAALTRVDDTNVTLTLGGSPTTALINAASLTLGWTGQLGLTRGGTAASLTADLGGIVYSTASALAILASTATAGKHLQSGASAAPSWTTATFPSTATGTGTLLRADGTNWVATTSTYPNTNAVNTLLYASSANVMAALATANSSVLVTDGSGVPSLSTTLPSGIAATNMNLTTPTLGAATATSLRISNTGILDNNGNTILTFLASGGTPVNYLRIGNNIATGSPTLAAIGGDTNISVQIDSKGTSGIVLKGATNGANVSAGYVGESTEANLANASATSLTTATAKNVTTISLTAGNWIITGNAIIQSSVASTQQIVWVSASSATLPDVSLRNGSTATNTYWGCQSFTLIARPTTTTTYYLSAYSVFASGTSTACGQISAVRLP